MAGAFFLLGVVSIAVIVFWAIRNDATPPDGATTGLLAMRPETPAAPPSATRSKRPAARRPARQR